jgi:uncharacterized coiled-coil DUF342 family protein
MNVKELIEELKKYPEDIDVLINDRDEMIVQGVDYHEEFCEECNKVHKHVRLFKIEPYGV